MSTWIIGGILFGLLALIIVRMIKNRSKGGCGCDCGGCPQAKSCHKE
jgi:hypothetical protein